MGGTDRSRAACEFDEDSLRFAVSDEVKAQPFRRAWAAAATFVERTSGLRFF